MKINFARKYLCALLLVSAAAIVLGAAACAQSKVSIVNAYGPAIQETYVDGKGVAITVAFDFHNDACTIRIEPVSNLETPGSAAMSTDQLDATLDELHIGHGRDYVGGVINGGVGLAGVGGSTRLYPNYSISELTSATHIPPGKFEYAVVTYLRKECRAARAINLKGKELRSKP